MGMKRIACLLLFLCGLPGLAFAQGEPSRFAISQVTFHSPVLTAYVDTLDGNGQPPATLSPQQFAVNINQQSLRVASVTPFADTGEGVAYTFLVDISRSIKRAQFDAMREQMNYWIAGMAPKDQMAIYTFGDQDKQLVDFTSDKTALTAALASVVPTDNQTKLYLALRNAMDAAQRVDAGLPVRRVIVILSDGKDEGSGWTADDVGHMILPSTVPIYAIGFSTLPAAERGVYLDALNRVAGISGGLYVLGSSLPEAYAQIRAAIRRVFVVQLACVGCRLSSQSIPLVMTLKSGSVVRTGLVPVTLAMVTHLPEKKSLWDRIQANVSMKVAIGASLGLLLVIIVPVAIVVYNHSHTVSPPPPTTSQERTQRFEPPPLPEPPVPPPPVVVPGRKVLLTVMCGIEPGRVQDVSLATRAVVGRDKSCNASYPEDDEMSARHFELVLAGSHVEVHDLGSTNGTIMNGARLTAQQRVESGDWVRAGRTELRITFGA
jgi:VWFA-related protein